VRRVLERLPVQLHRRAAVRDPIEIERRLRRIRAEQSPADEHRTIRLPHRDKPAAEILHLSLRPHVSPEKQGREGQANSRAYHARQGGERRAGLHEKSEDVGSVSNSFPLHIRGPRQAQPPT